MRKNVVTRMVVWFLFVAGIFCSASNVSAIVADPVKLGWSPASDASVKGYIIYYGATNQPTTNRIVAGTNLTVTINNLQANVTYKVYATSYNGAGVESPPSNQVLLTPKALPRLNLSRQANGSMKLDYNLTPGTVCAVQFSADMKPGSWRTLTNVTADLVGGIIAMDSTAAWVMQRFYRVVHSPQPLFSPISVVKSANSNVLLLSFTAPPGAGCHIQYVPQMNSSAWQTLAHVTADAEGNVTHTVSGPLTLLSLSQFYRVILE